MRLIRHCSVLLLVWASCAAVAQQYPARPIRALISFPAGSAAEFIARAMEPQLREKLGQLPVIDNRGGAGDMYRVVTDLGIFGFDDETKRMNIVALHPGVTAEQVQDNTGFELAFKPDIEATECPTERARRRICRRSCR